MDQKQKEILRDYLEGFNQLANITSFPVGALYFSRADKKEVKDFLNSEKINVVDTANEHEDVILKNLLEPIFKGQIVALDYTADLPGKVLNQLNNLISDQVDVTLATVKNPIVFKPQEKGGKLLILVNKDEFEQLPLQTLITSACNL